MALNLCKHQYADHCPHCAYERGKAEGIREGMERAAGICDSEATIEGIAQKCAQAIRQSAKEIK